MTAPTMRPSADEEPATVRPPARRRLAGSARGVAHALAAAGRRPWLIGPSAALLAAAAGLVVMTIPLLVVWMSTPDSGLGWGQTLRAGSIAWVVSHGVPVTLGTVAVTLLPWGLVLVPLGVVAVCVGWAVRACRTGASSRELTSLVATVAVTYAVVVAVVAWAASDATAGVAPVRAALHGLIVALAGSAVGVVRSLGIRPLEALPPWAAVTLRAGVVAAAVVVAFGALAAAAGLVVRMDDAVTMAQALGADVGGGLVLLVLGLGYVPVLVGWATSYVLGAGVVIGPSVVVSPFIPTTAPTQLPPFPLLAALPASASPLAWALPVAGVVAGIVAGLAIARLARTKDRLTRLVMAVAASAMGAVLLAAIAMLSTGSLGDGRLTALGPPVTVVALLGFVLIVIGAVPSAVVTAPPRKPRLAPASDTEETSDV